MGTYQRKYCDLQSQLKASQVVHQQIVFQLQQLLDENLELKVQVQRLQYIESEAREKDKQIENLQQVSIVILKFN
jgi:hypothetical protein